MSAANLAVRGQNVLEIFVQLTSLRRETDYGIKGNRRFAIKVGLKKTVAKFVSIYCQVIMVRPCLLSRYVAKIILLGTKDGSRRGGRQRKSWSHQGMARPVIVIIAVHRRR